MGTVVGFLTRVMIVPPIITIRLLVALNLSHVNKMLRFWVSLFNAIKKSLEELLAAHAENQRGKLGPVVLLVTILLSNGLCQIIHFLLVNFQHLRQGSAIKLSTHVLLHELVEDARCRSIEALLG